MKLLSHPQTCILHKTSFKEDISCYLLHQFLVKNKMYSIVEVGGNGGEPFNFNGQENGSLLKKIQVWEGDSQIKAVMVVLADNRIAQFGIPAGELQEFTFKNDEIFDSLSLSPNQEGTHLGAIKFSTNTGKQFFASMKSGKLKPEVQVDVASGKCIGIQGRSSSGIDRFGFMMLNK
ncbi:aerolysin-like protein [Tachysurus fulvidraco]|uniref:aerolysin-like protein n=1 Tax=Tachysurus fulvidraco TaxID=1234273 RepID=UPI001FEEC5A7|nr:aerolysin-like protein [Tachysurus fulvidraco]